MRGERRRGGLRENVVREDSWTGKSEGQGGRGVWENRVVEVCRESQV